MLDFEILGEEAILQLHPYAPLRVRDFAEINQAVNRYLNHYPSLSGLLVCSPELPGWEDFADLVHHLEFIDNHHRSIRKVATVTDHSLGRLMTPIGDHFSGADLRHFAQSELEVARLWLHQPPFTPPRHLWPDQSHGRLL